MHIIWSTDASGDPDEKGEPAAAFVIPWALCVCLAGVVVGVLFFVK